MRLSVSIQLALISLACADEWETIEGCRLIDNAANDGDSFHVEADGEERIFRLYFVDTPETHDDARMADRIAEQAELFGITEEESLETGKKAAAFTRAVLSRPFTVTTRGQNARGASALKREYAFVETADGEDLGEMLVSRGLARSFGEDAALPPYRARDLRDKYDQLEAEAKHDKLGAWGAGAASPTIALSDAKPASEQSENSNAGPGSSLRETPAEGASGESHGDGLVAFGSVSLGATEQEFRRAYPRAKRGDDWSAESETLQTYYLKPPDTEDADSVRFIFAQGRLMQIDHEYSKERLDERGGWQTDFEALSEMFGRPGKSEELLPDLVPKWKLLFTWKSEGTGEAASLDVYADGSSQVSFLKPVKTKGSDQLAERVERHLSESAKDMARKNAEDAQTLIESAEKDAKAGKLR
jgi:endonuclease YncB( thermonuclease family)